MTSSSTGVVAGTVDWAARCRDRGRRGSHRGGRRRWRDVCVVAGTVVVVVVDVVVDVDVVVVVAAASRRQLHRLDRGRRGRNRGHEGAAHHRGGEDHASSDAITRRAGLRRTAGQYGERRRQIGELAT